MALAIGIRYFTQLANKNGIQNKNKKNALFQKYIVFISLRNRAAQLYPQAWGLSTTL
jgi:hypothetical protein